MYATREENNKPGGIDLRLKLTLECSILGITLFLHGKGWFVVEAPEYGVLHGNVFQGDVARKVENSPLECVVDTLLVVRSINRVLRVHTLKRTRVTKTNKHNTVHAKIEETVDFGSVGPRNIHVGIKASV